MGFNSEKILVLGLSKSGIAAAKLAKKHGADVYLTEGKKEVNNDSVTELENLGIHVEFGTQKVQSLLLQVLEFLLTAKLCSE